MQPIDQLSKMMTKTNRIVSCIAISMCAGCMSSVTRFGPVVTNVVKTDHGNIGIKRCMVEVEISASYLANEIEVTGRFSDCVTKLAPEFRNDFAR